MVTLELVACQHGNTCGLAIVHPTAMGPRPTSLATCVWDLDY